MNLFTPSALTVCPESKSSLRLRGRVQSIFYLISTQSCRLSRRVFEAYSVLPRRWPLFPSNIFASVPHFPESVLPVSWVLLFSSLTRWSVESDWQERPTTAWMLLLCAFYWWFIRTENSWTLDEPNSLKEQTVSSVWIQRTCVMIGVTSSKIVKRSCSSEL